MYKGAERSTMTNFKNSTFLGGTCANSTWREELLQMLKPAAKENTFNPVVPDWTPECQAIEDQARAEARFVLFVLTKEMTGVFSVAEVVDCSNKAPERTIFCYLAEDFDGHMAKSLKATAKMVAGNGATVLGSLQEVADFLNEQY